MDRLIGLQQNSSMRRRW